LKRKARSPDEGAASPSPIRVLMAVPKYPFPVAGGLERQAHELARALIARGHTVHAISGRFHPAQSSRSVVDRVVVHRLPWSDVRLVRFVLAPLAIFVVLWRLRKKIDIVHVHNISWFGAFVSLSAWAIGKPVMTKLPNMGEFGVPGLRRRRFGNLRIALLKRSDAIVAMAPQSIEELSAIGYPSERIFKVTNGIEVLEQPAGERPAEPVRVVFVGRLSPEKGLNGLLRGWKNICARVTRPVELRIVGDGPQESELRALADELNVASTVSFRGHSDEVAGELAVAGVFVLPSRAEGNSNAVLEAMRAGLPVVATRVGGTAIQVGSEGSAFLVEPDDQSGLEDRLMTLIEDEELRLRTGSAMRTRIETHFDIGKIAACYEQAYALILSGEHGRIGELNPAVFDLQDGVVS
jgi:glycosyltransferase involved in cell wall biosynthesis